MEVHHRQKRGGDHRAGQALHIVGQPRERKRFRVFLLIGQNVGNCCLEGWREAGRRGLQNEDLYIDLPEPIGNIPPAEAEERYYAMLDEARMAA